MMENLIKEWRRYSAYIAKLNIQRLEDYEDTCEECKVYNMSMPMYPQEIKRDFTGFMDYISDNQ